jgi:hypothetical protein
MAGCPPRVPDGRAPAHREAIAVFRWCHACVAALVAVFAGFAALPAYGDAPIDYKYPFGDSQGTEIAITSSVSVIPLKEGGGEPKPGETGAKLRVTLKERTGYEAASDGYDFFKVLDGSYPVFKDTDSAQVAVRWSKQGTADLGHDTNAKAGGLRTSSADWTQGNVTKPNRDAYWETDIPTDATHVEVVLVYNDMLMDTNAERQNNTTAQTPGDMPGVIGSWSGDRQADGTWTFTANNGDVFQHQADYPTNAQVTAGITSAKNVVNTKTGYTLQERPATLAGIAITNSAAINTAINTAVTNKQINPPPEGHDRSHDTGFDIIRR